MTTVRDWNDKTGRSWAEMYRHTDRSFASLTEQLLGRIAELPGKSVLDIGCGAGELALAVARARPSTHVIGLDISPDLIAAARGRGSQHANAEFALGDAATWRRDGFAPELLVSRHGVMFFDDPVSAFANLHSQAVPGASLFFSCFRTPRENPWMTQLAALLPTQDDVPPPDPLAPGPFAFADSLRVESILADAGWTGVTIAPADYAYVAGAGADPVADAMDFFAHIGPAAQALSELQGAVKERVIGEMREWLEEHRDGDMVLFPAAAWLVSARKG